MAHETFPATIPSYGAPAAAPHPLPAETPDPDLALAEALAIRLCHDLSGLAGTVAGLLDLSGTDAETLREARTGARHLLGRLRLARAAWGGTADWPGGALSELLNSLAGDRLRVTVDAATLSLGRDPALGRLLLNVALLGAEILRHRGEMRVRAESPDRLAITLADADPRRILLWPALDSRQVTQPQRFQQALTARLAGTVGVTLRPAQSTLRILLAA